MIPCGDENEAAILKPVGEVDIQCLSNNIKCSAVTEQVFGKSEMTRNHATFIT